MLAQRLLRDWYRGAAWLYLLWPLSWIFATAVRWRRRRMLRSASKRWRAPVPVIVIGNITLGGTGKSPLAAALIRHLQDLGYKPGLISRGYGGHANHYPLAVNADSDPAQCGDEPVMLAQQLNCPIVVDPLRVRAAQSLLQNHACDLLISDDGLQHYALRRDLEILVMDGARGIGNGWCLPAGPLREPKERMGTVDAIVCNGIQQLALPQPSWDMRLMPQRLVALVGDHQDSPEAWRGRKVHAVAGIGNPERFFGTLRGLGMEVFAHAFPDHHDFHVHDVEFHDGLPVIMTEKDAVKCRPFGLQNAWALRVNAEFDPAFLAWLDKRLVDIRKSLSSPLDKSPSHG